MSDFIVGVRAGSTPVCPECNTRLVTRSVTGDPRDPEAEGLLDISLSGGRAFHACCVRGIAASRPTLRKCLCGHEVTIPCPGEDTVIWRDDRIKRGGRDLARFLHQRCIDALVDCVGSGFTDRSVFDFALSAIPWESASKMARPHALGPGESLSRDRITAWAPGASTSIKGKLPLPLNICIPRHGAAELAAEYTKAVRIQVANHATVGILALRCTDPSLRKKAHAAVEQAAPEAPRRLSQASDPHTLFIEMDLDPNELPTVRAAAEAAMRDKAASGTVRWHPWLRCDPACAWVSTGLVWLRGEDAPPLLFRWELPATCTEPSGAHPSDPSHASTPTAP